MAKLFILYTCDDWKSRSSMDMYYIGTSTKSGMKRLVQAVAKGIKERKFRYRSDGETSVSEQIESLKDDMKQSCACTLVYDINARLDCGFVELVQCNSYQ